MMNDDGKEELMSFLSMIYTKQGIFKNSYELSTEAKEIYNNKNYDKINNYLIAYFKNQKNKHYLNVVKERLSWNTNEDDKYGGGENIKMYVETFNKIIENGN